MQGNDSHKRASAKSALRRGFLSGAGSDKRPGRRSNGNSGRALDELANLAVPAGTQQPEHIARVARDLRAQTATSAGEGAGTAASGMRQLRIVQEPTQAEAAAGRMMSCAR